MLGLSARRCGSRLRGGMALTAAAGVLLTGVGMSPASAAQSWRGGVAHHHPPPGPAVITKPKPGKHKPAYDLAADEHALAHWVNAERASARLVPLGWSGELATVARAQSQRMIATGQVFHDPHLGTDVHDWHSLGENVGRARGVVALEQAMLADPIDRANLLGPDFRQIGVGVRVRNGLLYVTVVVRRPLTAVRR